MNTEKTPKQRYKEETTPYRAWLNSISIPVALIVLFIAVFLGLTINVAGMIIFVFAIITHVNYKKIQAPKVCYTAPILYYIYNAISISYIIILISYPQASLLAAVLSLINFALLILVIVFYFISARAIKKQFPTMKADYTQATEAYKRGK